MIQIRRVGVIGSADVAKALTLGFRNLGFEVMISNRDRPSQELSNWCQSGPGQGAKCGSFKEAAAFGELIVMATLGLAAEQAIKKAGLDHFEEKVVWDATNPLDSNQGFPPVLAGSVGDSGGERIQRLLVRSKVVKVFNTVGHGIMFGPKYSGGRPDMFICSDFIDAKSLTIQLLEKFGWNGIDTGGISSSHYLESMAMVWILSASLTSPQSWGQAFKMLRPTG